MVRLQDVGLLNVGHTIQMVGAIYADSGKAYLCLFPDEEVLPLETLEMGVDDWNAFLRQTDLLETEILQRASDGTLAKAIVRKSQRQISQVVSWNVFKRDGYACRYCGNDDTPLTVDHLVLWESGGPSTEDNLVAACRKCNKVRGDTPYVDWLDHPYYRKVSKGLDDAARERNRLLASTLDSVTLVIHKRTRR